MYEELKHLTCSLTLFFQVAVDWGLRCPAVKCLFSSTFFAYYIQPILLKHFQRHQLSILVWVHHPMERIVLTKFSDLMVNNDNLVIDTKDFLSRFCRVFVILLHHHHHVVLVAQISLNLSRHSSLSFIALGRSSGQHPVFSHSCWMYVRAGRPAFARPCVGGP